MHSPEGYSPARVTEHDAGVYQRKDKEFSFSQPKYFSEALPVTKFFVLESVKRLINALFQ